MIKKILFLTFLMQFSFGFSQNLKRIDSLENEIKNYDLDRDTKAFSKKDTLKVNLLLQISYEYSGYNDQKQLIYANEAMSIAEKIDYEKGIGKSFSRIGLANNGFGNFDEAVKNYDKAIAIFRQLKIEKDLANNIYYSGSSYLNQGNLPKAAERLNEALVKYEKLNNKLKTAIVYNNLAILYSKQNKDKEQLEYYKKALETLEHSQNISEINFKNVLQFNLALFYCDKHKNEKSLEMLFKMLPISSETNISRSSVLKIIGKNYLLMNQNDKAINYFNQSLAIYETKMNKSGMGDSKRYIGQAYFQKDDLPKAIEYVKSGLKLSKEINEVESIKFCYELLQKIYSKQEDHKKAYENLLLYKQASDSLFNKEVNSKVTQIQMTYEFEKKQERIKKQQEAKNKILKQEAEKQRNIKTIALIAFVLISITSFIVYVNLRRNKRQKKIIENQKALVENQNELIQKSLEEKETLLREIHHRVKNNLQIISSLLNIQAEEIDDQKVLSSLNEGQSRVEAMSLIHQNLYQSEHINNIDIENYIKDLISYLSQLYLDQNKDIKTIVQANNLKFDIDTAIPLGLIINELVSNAFKYAFVNKKQGNIWVSITEMNNDCFELFVEDEGEGLPHNFSIDNSKSLGLSLVKMLTRQLKGEFFMDSKNKKTKFVVHFKNLK